MPVPAPVLLPPELLLPPVELPLPLVELLLLAVLLLGVSAGGAAAKGEGGCTCAVSSQLRASRGGCRAVKRDRGRRLWASSTLAPRQTCRGSSEAEGKAAAALVQFEHVCRVSCPAVTESGYCL